MRIMHIRFLFILIRFLFKHHRFLFIHYLFLYDYFFRKRLASGPGASCNPWC